MTPDQRWALDLREQIEELTRDVKNLFEEVRRLWESVNDLWAEDNSGLNDLADRITELEKHEI